MRSTRRRRTAALAAGALMLGLLPLGSASGPAAASSGTPMLFPRIDSGEAVPWTVPRTGTYRFELIGAGGGGGNRSSWDTIHDPDYDSGWQAGGGGGGGAFAAGTLTLAKDQVVLVTTGTGGPGAGTWQDSNGAAGGDSTISIGGTVVIRAGGGRFGYGYSDSNGGDGGTAAFDASVADQVGYPGGRGANALILVQETGGYHQGGEGGSAANSTGQGNAGSTQRCVWTATAVPGSMPAGAGGFGYYGGYDDPGTCFTTNPPDVEPLNWESPAGMTGIGGLSYGGGGGGGHDHIGGGYGADGLIRITPLDGVPPRDVSVEWNAGDLEVSWNAVLDATSYVATANPGSRTCSTSSTSCTITGLTAGTAYAITIVSKEGSTASEPSDPLRVVAGAPPGQVGAITIGPANFGAKVSWGAVSAPGQSPIESYAVTSSPDGLMCTSTTRSCTITGLRAGVAYTFSVTATSHSGTGPARESASTTFAWPKRPLGLAEDEGHRTTSASYVTWAAPTGSLAIDHYLVQVSRDGGDTWAEPVEVGVDAKDGYKVPDLTAKAQAAMVRVSSVSEGRLSLWTAPIVVKTAGKRTWTFRMTDSRGRPISGGAMAWGTLYYDNVYDMDEYYGLTADGTFELPSLPAGPTQLAVTDAMTADGFRVAMAIEIVLGFADKQGRDLTDLQFPDVQAETRTIKVQLPNGLPVAGVKATIVEDLEGYAPPHVDADCLTWRDWTRDENDECLAYGGFESWGGSAIAFNQTVSSVWVGGGRGGLAWDADFVVAEAPARTTGPDGTVALTGFFFGHVPVEISYNGPNGVTKFVRYIRNRETVLTIPSMPYVSIPKQDEEQEADKNTAVVVDMTVLGDNAIPARASLALGITPRTKVAKTITIVPPLGAPKPPTSCKQTLNGSPNAGGTLSLKVCATKSGIYTLKTTGVAATEAVLLKVRKTPPMPVRDVVARSPKRGNATVAWTAPLYDGDAAITGYSVTLTLRHVDGIKDKTADKQPIVVSTSGSKRSLSLATGLKHGRTYTIKITAKNKYGTSDVVTSFVPVA